MTTKSAKTTTRPATRAAQDSRAAQDARAIPAAGAQDALSTRDRLARAAAYLIHRRGYHGVGLSDVLARAGAPKGVLYHHFPGGKPELAEAAIDFSAAVFNRQIDRAAAGASSAAALIKAMGDLTADDLLQTDYNAGCPLATVALETAPNDERLSAACRRGFDLWLATMTRHLDRFGVDDAAGVAELTLSALEGALALARTRRSVDGVHATAARLAAMVDGY
ncbi:MAG: helix-turn-helix domain-containing protein [Pseudomonadota bacterium]